MKQDNTQADGAAFQWRHFRQQLHAAFNVPDLFTLCFDLGIPRDQLGGEETGKQERVTRLLRAVHSQGQVGQLLAMVREERPQVRWPAGLPSQPKSDSPFGVPHRFQAFIDERTRDFVGREYIFSAIADLLEGRPSGYIELEGDPGAGKSAILAEYVQRFDIVAHFNIRGSGVNTSRHFLESICAQLIERFHLPYPSLPAAATQDGSFLATLLEQASAKLPAGRRLVIGVDALDEVDMAGHRSGAYILYLPGSLPDRVHFLVTRRKVKLPMPAHVRRDLIDLMVFADEGQEDVRRFLEQALAEQPALRRWIASRPQELTAEEFVSTLAEKSENNFMYLRHVLPDIALGVYQDLEIKDLPVGLNDYYEHHWRWMGMEADPLPESKLNIIYTICEAKLPLTRTMVCEFTRERALAVQTVLNEWRQFLHVEQSGGETVYSIYHTSFRDFLMRQGTVSAAGIDLRNIHGQIGRNLLRELRGDG
jgi:hypothetical protein